MATTFFEPSVERKTGVNPLGLKGIDHIEFIVDNADQWRDFFVGKYGMAGRFYADNASGVKGRRAHVVGQGRRRRDVGEPVGGRPAVGGQPGALGMVAPQLARGVGMGVAIDLARDPVGAVPDLEGLRVAGQRVAREELERPPEVAQVERGVEAQQALGQRGRRRLRHGGGRGTDLLRTLESHGPK